MYKIKLLNTIDANGLKQLPSHFYQISNEVADPDAILVRSALMHEMEFSSNLQVIARAGAGVNNIPVAKLTELGIPVLNTPGANANAVKELVLAGMLMASRNLCQAWHYVRQLSGDDALINAQVERDKKQFAGFELPGKTLGIIGLGSIGVKVANAAVALGMRVIGYDPSMTVKNAWELSANVQGAHNLEDLVAQADFISLHVPLNAETKNLINASRLHLIKNKAVLLNFSRDGIVDKSALKVALDEKRLFAYVSDFPCSQLKEYANVISLPHLGASTQEAEQTCAVMAVEQVRDYLENGNITHSVNFPSAEMPFKAGTRLAIINANIPNVVAQISTKLANLNMNIVDLLNKSRDHIAYTLIDTDSEVSDQLLQEIATINGVIRLRRLKKSVSDLQATPKAALV